MTEHEQTPEQEFILNELFAPGNLVWGTNGGIEEIISQGILPAILRRNKKRYVGREDSICLSLLCEFPNPLDRYNYACRYGPKDPDSEGTGIILDREKLLTEYLGRIYALGEIFKHTSFQTGYSYSFSEEDIKAPLGRVFGIPISQKGYHERPPFPDEVVIRFGNESSGNILGITPDFWKGLVTQEKYGATLLQTLQKTGLIHLPIVSPEGKILHRGSL